MQENSTQLSISTDVIEKMTEIATTEIEGVAGIAKKAIDLRSAVKNRSAFKGVKVESINGAVTITVYIVVNKDTSAHTVAQAVQANVKDKVQSMTGTAVTKVNVIVSDIDMEDPEVIED